MKNYLFKNLPGSISFLFFFISLICIKSNYLSAEYIFEELEIDTSTKTDEDGSILPTNPFELVEMIWRQNSLNDATNPSDAIDDALKSFNNFEEQLDIYNDTLLFPNFLYVEKPYPKSY